MAQGPAAGFRQKGGDPSWEWRCWFWDAAVDGKLSLARFCSRVELDFPERAQILQNVATALWGMWVPDGAEGALDDSGFMAEGGLASILAETCPNGVRRLQQGPPPTARPAAAEVVLDADSDSDCVIVGAAPAAAAPGGAAAAAAAEVAAAAAEADGVEIVAAPTTLTPDAVLKRELHVLGFTKDQINRCMEAIPTQNRGRGAVDWCLDWKAGTLDSLQSLAATREDCRVCMAEPAAFLMNCPNKCSVCRDCLAAGLRVNIQEHQVEQLQCPMGDGGALPPVCVAAALTADRDLYEKYLSLAARKASEKGGECVFCPSCEWFGVATAPEEKWAVKCANGSCPSLKTDREGFFCGLCGEKPHIKQKDQDISCEKYAEWRQANDGSLQAFKQFMQKKKMQVCPKCGEASELITGCHWVVCRCRTRYCYDCGRTLPYERQHYTHWVGGPFSNKCFGGKQDTEGFTAVGGECPNCLGWSFGSTQCTCRYWQTGGKPPEGEAAQAAQPARLMQVGDRVRLKDWVAQPQHGWGKARRGEVGVCAEVDGQRCVIRFKAVKQWRGYAPEMLVVGARGSTPTDGQHPGMWRVVPGRMFFCSRPQQLDGVECAHGEGVLTFSHWSCCGADDVDAPGCSGKK